MTTLREQIRISILIWLGSKYTVTPHGAAPSDKDIDQNSVEKLVDTLYGIFTSSESNETKEAGPFKGYYIININGSKISIPYRYLRYEDIVGLSGYTPGIYSITFHQNFDNYKHEGTVAPGEEIIITDGTIINCYHTGAA